MSSLQSIIREMIGKAVSVPSHYAFQRLNNAYRDKNSITGRDLEAVGKQVHPEAELDSSNPEYFHSVRFPTRKGDVTIFFPDRQEHTPCDVIVYVPVSHTLRDLRFFEKESTRLVDAYRRNLEAYTPYRERMYRTTPIGSK
jgi:hypothetical protein